MKVNPSFILIALISVLNIFLGLVVIKRARTKTNWFFLGIALTSTLWTASVFFSDLKTFDYSTSLILNRLTFTSSSLLVLFFFLFSFYFPQRLKTKLNILLYSVVTIATFVVPLTLTPYIIESVREESWGWNVSTGSAYLLYLFYFGIGVVGSLVILANKYLTIERKYKTQIKYVLLGTLSTAIFASITNLLLPLITNNNPFAKYGPLSLAFFIMFTTYAIVRHRLMDIRLVVARSVTYAILLAILALFYAGSVLAIERVFFSSSFDKINLTQGAVRTVLAVIMAFSFQPLRRWITKKTDKIFFKNAYDPQKMLDDLSHTMGSTIVLIELLYKVTDILIEDMKVSRGLFVLLKDESELYTVQANGYRQNPEVDIEDIIHLAKDGTVVYDELEETSKYKNILRRYEAAVSLPLKTEKEIVGVFLVGEKNSGDMFSQQDLRILEIIAPEVSVAIENAKSYEEISRFNVTLRNEVKRATQRLKDKNQELRELDKAKDEFISMASHQLRTPLTAIKGYLSMLLDGDAGEIKVGQYDFINEAYSGANRMVGLINDLLNVSRMETGRFFLEPEDLEIDQIINEEVRQLTNTAKEKGIYLKIDKKKDAPSVWADETKIRQVIMNFIDNAIHYTTKGGVTVSYGKERGHFVFSVKDTGIGVPREQQKKLFEKFFRADNARHTRPDGTGLGLFLAKRVVEDHNGSIFFSSIEGQGSVFGFRLPMKKSEKIKASTLEPRPAVIPSATANVLKDEAEEKNPEDVLTEQRQVPIPMNEPEHVLKK